MPPASLYDGRAKQPRTHKPPKISTEKRKEIQQRRLEKDHALMEDVDGLLKGYGEGIATVAKNHGRTVGFVTKVAGGRGIEHKVARAANPRNGWLKKRMAEVNAGRPRGKKLKLKEFNEQYGHEYDPEMDDDEKENYCKIIADHREALHPTSRKTLKGAQKDVDATMAMVFQIIERLERRTGFQVTVFAHKGDFESYSIPQTRVAKSLSTFFDVVLDIDPVTLVRRMEAYALNGAEGVAKLVRSTMADQRTEITTRLKKSLLQVTELDKVQLNYEQWHYRTLIRYSVRLEGWPLDYEPKDPSTMLKADLNKVFKAITSKPPTLKFVKMTEEEAEQLQAARDKLEKDGKAAPYRPRKRKASKKTVNDENSDGDDLNGGAGSDTETARPQKKKRAAGPVGKASTSSTARTQVSDEQDSSSESATRTAGSSASATDSGPSTTRSSPTL